jgi:hypothetical protein
VPGKPFEPRLMFAVKARSLPLEGSTRNSSLFCIIICDEEKKIHNNNETCAIKLFTVIIIAGHFCPILIFVIKARVHSRRAPSVTPPK